MVETVCLVRVLGGVMGRKSVSDKMGAITNGKVLAFGGTEVGLPISGAAGADA